MKTLLLLLTVVILAVNCTQNARSVNRAMNLKFTGSTPGDKSIKSLIGIPTNDSIDFMRWELVLGEMNQPFFVLNLNYGLSKPNTSGFQPGDKTMTIRGTYESRHLKTDSFNGEVYDLISSDFTNDTISLVKIGNRALHILERGNSLMVGNGGWSYTLNLSDRPDEEASPLITLVSAANILNDTSLEVIFDGRTPCSEIAMAFNFNPPRECLKLKWRLTLYRDTVTMEPSTYKLQRTNIRDTGIATGKWTVYCHSDSTVIYKLDPDKPDNSLLLLAGDENVLFFLDKDYRLFPGNDNFSYTLNRKNPV